MKTGRIVGILLLLSLLAVAAVLWWKQGEIRRTSLSTLLAFEQALQTGHSADLLNLIIAPAAISGRTTAERVEFLTKALRDEISPEGLAVLQRQGEFGSLEKLFPKEGAAWAAQAGVQPTNCVAFKLEREVARAEVVLLREGETYRIVRCNNVKQLAGNL